MKIFIKLQFILFGLALALVACQANSPATGQPVAGSPAPESAGNTAPVTPTPTQAASEETASADLLAQLTEADGEVLARPDNDSEFTSLLIGHSIQTGGQVATGLAASARLDLSDGSIVRMGPNSFFTLEPAEETESGLLARIRLDLGQIWVILNGQALDVDTPSGVASVRGSYLSVVAGREGLIYITCLEGNCSLTTDGGTVNLVAGQTAVVNGITNPPTPGTMEPEDVEEWLNANPEATVVIPQVTATVAAVAADPDRDFDGYPDSIDQCPLQGDVGNGVDSRGCPLSFGEGDYDQDGVPNASDACPRRGDLGHGLDGRGCPLPPPDADGDGYPDAIDSCPTLGDRGFGLDALGCPIPPPGADEDGDGVPNELDVCPNQGDKGFGVDSRGCPNGSPDSDGDGVPDTQDRCPNDGNRGFGVTQDGCPLPAPDGDFDKDGIPNGQDRCPLKGDAGYGIDSLGCPILPPDTDKDGVPDAQDACPRQGDAGYGLRPDGCPLPPPDSDGDGIPDPSDRCPQEGNQGYGLTADGCPSPPTDADGDGVPDRDDACPNQGDAGYGLRANGCPLPRPDTDSGGGGGETLPDRDGDGVPDAEDSCPDRPGDARYGGCPDSDGDGVPDHLDNCISQPGPESNRGCPTSSAAHPGSTFLQWAVIRVSLQPAQT